MKISMAATRLTYFAAGIVISTATAPDSSGDQATFVVPSPPLASSPKVITPAVSAFVEDALLKSSIPGLSMGVVRLNSSCQPVVELAAWGRQTEEGDGNNLSSKALFAMASCSKAFLVTAVGLLMDDFAGGRNVTPLPSGLSRFDWDTKVRDLLPSEWGYQDEWAERSLTLRDAFSHLSGLPRHDYSYKPGDTTADVLQRLKHLSPAYELREQWMYNNQMYMVGAHIVSELSGVTYQSFVSSRILAPLNMSSTTFSPSEAAKTGRLTQTWTRGVRRIPFWFSNEVADLFAGAGGIISSAEDMTNWLAVLLNEGVDPLTNATIIPPSVFGEMTTARAVVSGVAAGPLSIMGYGMGWFRVSYRGHDAVWHFGAIPGFSTLVAFLPEDNLGAVLLANMDEKQDDNMRILFRVIDEALDLPQSGLLPFTSCTSCGRPFSMIRTTHNMPTPLKSNTGTPPDQQLRTGEHEPLPLELEAYAGTYADPLGAYGNITLCAPTSASPSAYCARVLADFAPIEESARSSSPPSLFAAWPRVWSSHVRLRHTVGSSFALTLPRLFPQGFGRNPTPFEFYDSQISVGRVEFVVEDGEVMGFALVTDEQAAAARERRWGGSVKGVGDAWFGKVQS
ncbi:beta-lactamase/transpeptidase-like protein [Ganoderma leucocontextum]|nr:beta-lactamase/transpeptidase-like protein [Ganoderma leucocontextum]